MSSQKRVHPDGDRLEHRRQRSVGVKDIAEASGVSIATVDRALHNRGRISQATRERILRIAEALGYQPNLAARYLKKPKALRISIHLPAEIALFWDKIRCGIEEAAKPLIQSGKIVATIHQRPKTQGKARSPSKRCIDI